MGVDVRASNWLIGAPSVSSGLLKTRAEPVSKGRTPGGSIAGVVSRPVDRQLHDLPYTATRDPV